ncbi:hypothetical protein MP638_006301 [Amoeboaphelidium occidentale]|nr:hypothetical protein MP638_006301 [Amoeboaphelidium occidentale]
MNAWPGFRKMPARHILRSISSLPKIKLKTAPKHEAIERAVPEKATITPRSSRRVLTRDFIHDSLYNKDYGYFSKRAVIFSPPEPIKFNELKDATEFSEEVARLYREYDDIEEEESLQVWHTPTELFQPYYGRAIANHIWTLWQQKYKDEPIVIYEMGAGNGTLMKNILDFIKEKSPKAYDNIEYNIIEISKQLTERQQWTNMSHLEQLASKDKKINIINKSIFEWDVNEERPCVFIALEVIDNFAHDAIRYNLSTPDIPHNTPLQTLVVRKEDGDLDEEYGVIKDELVSEYLSFREKVGYVSPLLKKKSILQSLYSKLMFAPNVSDPEFIPTMQFIFMKILHDKFPRHNMIVSDFDSLPSPIKGIDAPVVQTRQKYRMVPCSTYMVTPGWFDIFFPTNFELMADIYNEIGERKGHQKQTRVVKHEDFLKEFGEIEKTKTKSGDNPMLINYQNVKFILSS